MSEIILRVYYKQEADRLTISYPNKFISKSIREQKELLERAADELQSVIDGLHIIIDRSGEGNS